MLELVKVTNDGPEPITLHHDAEGDITIAPGEQKITTIEMVAVNFGHPAARDTANGAMRAAEYAQVLTRWGHYPGLESTAEWDARKPKIQVHTFNDERIYTVLEDPEGTMAQPNLATSIPDDAPLHERVVQLEAQLAQTLALINQGAPATSADPAPADTAPSDTPDAAPGAIVDNAERDLPTPKQSGKRRDDPSSTRVGSQ